MLRSFFVGLFLVLAALGAHASATSTLVFTKAFGAASIPLNGSTSLTFTLVTQGIADITGITFTDTLPVGLVVDTPNGSPTATPAGCLGLGAITAVAASGSISISASTVLHNVTCSFAVNVKGTSLGAKNNSVTVPIAGLGNLNAGLPTSLTAVAELFVGVLPSPANVPTLSQWGLILSAVLLGLSAFWAFKRRVKPA
jgi:IPTL-CTERM motif